VILQFAFDFSSYLWSTKVISYCKTKRREEDKGNSHRLLQVSLPVQLNLAQLEMYTWIN